MNDGGEWWLNGVVGCNGGGGERCGGDVVVVADGIGGDEFEIFGFFIFHFIN